MTGYAAPRILVIGAGNPDRGDDGVGALVVRLLSGKLPPEVGLLARPGDMLGLIAAWEACDLVICIDAAAPSGEPGHIDRFDLGEDALPIWGASTSSHGFGLAETIALARNLGRAPGRIILYAIEGGEFECGAAMTPEVAAAAEMAAERIVAEIGGLGNEMI